MNEMAKGVIRTTFGRIRSHHITDPNSVVCHSEQVCKDVRKEVTKWKPMFHRQTDRLYSPFSFWQTESATSNRHHRANPPHKDTHWPLISSIHWTKMMVNTHINPSLSNHTINIQSSANLLLIVVCCPVDLVMEGELFLYYPKTRHIDAGCLSMFRFFFASLSELLTLFEFDEDNLCFGWIQVALLPNINWWLSDCTLQISPLLFYS